MSSIKRLFKRPHKKSVSLADHPPVISPPQAGRVLEQSANLEDHFTDHPEDSAASIIASGHAANTASAINDEGVNVSALTGAIFNDLAQPIDINDTEARTALHEALSTPMPPADSAQKRDLRRRRPLPENRFPAEEEASLEGLEADRATTAPTTTTKSLSKSSWLLLAFASGAFAAFNGAFAKLTTTSLTSSITGLLASTLAIPLESGSYSVLDISIRSLFFILNLVSNGIMWALFTRALTAHESATQVSILNTSANFLVTAVLGVVIFGEELGSLWFLGAGFLVIGNVIIGRKGEQAPSAPAEVNSAEQDSKQKDLDKAEGEEEWDALADLDDRTHK